MSDHTEAVHSKKAEIDEEADISRRSSLYKEESRHSHASLKHADSLESKKITAHLSAVDVSAAHQRKELYDAIDDAAAHRKAHDLELKTGFAAANRVDILHGIQEKQKHLQ